MRISAHLCFHGQCGEAFRMYERLFGGQLVSLAYRDTPMADRVPAEHGDWIVHATLTVDGTTLMGADVPEPVAPTGFFVLISIRELARAQQVFAALADGGTIHMPLAPTFWSPGFGVVIDRFGVPWEISTEQ